MNWLQEAFARLVTTQPELTPTIRKAIERAVSTVDPQLRHVGGFERRLGEVVASALDHAAALVSQLPGPRVLSHGEFARDPLVHALFATADDIDHTLGRSQAVRDWLHETRSYEADHFYALFAARRVEKRQLGIAVQGDVIQSDVPQVVMYFSDQTLTEPALDFETLKDQLQSSFFDALLKHFTTHLQALRAERESVRAGLSMERAHLSVLRSKTSSAEFEVHTRKLEALDAKLRELGGTLAPSALIDALVEYLRKPGDAFRLEPFSVTIDRLGVVSDSLEPNPLNGFSRLDFPEMIGRDRRRYMVMTARVEREEARLAIERVTSEQRRFLII